MEGAKEERPIAAGSKRERDASARTADNQLCVQMSVLCHIEELK